MKTIQAGTVSWATFQFFDKNNDPVVPDSVSYSVWCDTNDQSVRGATAAVPAAVLEIQLEASDNTIIDAANPFEVRKVCVTATFGASDSRVDILRYRILPPETCA